MKAKATRSQPALDSAAAELGVPRRDLELRSYHAGDAAGVWRLHNLALDDAGVHGGRGPWEDDLRDIRATYLDSGGAFLVGLIDGDVVAIGGLLLHSVEKAEIKRMRVHPDFQRLGLGRLILEELERRAQALERRVINLDTTEEQIAARRLYESAGYRVTGRRQAGRFSFIDYGKELDSSRRSDFGSSPKRDPDAPAARAFADHVSYSRPQASFAATH